MTTCLKTTHWAASLFYAILAAIFSTGISSAQDLSYDAEYHLGFIKVTAGHADISINIEGDNIFATLNGQSIPWHGRVYAISDTIRASVVGDGRNLAESVITLTGRYSKPKVRQLDSGNYDRSDPGNYQTIYGRGDLSASSETMEAVTITADMLALFKVFRMLDFATMQPDDRLYIPITLPNGDIQHVAITYHGRDTYRDSQTYSVVFEYTYHGQMSNYPVTCQIDQASRLPLMFSADLKIGHIELVLNQ